MLQFTIKSIFISPPSPIEKHQSLLSFQKVICDLIFFIVLYQLEEQLSTAIHILNQALQVTEDMVLPTAPSLLSHPKMTDKSEPEKASSEAEPTSEEGTQSVDVDIADEDKTRSEGDVKNGSDDCNGSNAAEKMDTTTDSEEVFTVKKEDIIAQVCAFLGWITFFLKTFFIKD